MPNIISKNMTCQVFWVFLVSHVIHLYVYVCVCVCIYIYVYMYMYTCGLGRSVGIATDYRLDGPGSNPGGDKIFCPSKQILGPTQPPVKWVPVLSRG